MISFYRGSSNNSPVNSRDPQNPTVIRSVFRRVTTVLYDTLYNALIEPIAEITIGPTTPAYISTRPPEPEDLPGTVYRYKPQETNNQNF